MTNSEISHSEIAIIGAGIGGLATALALLKNSLRDERSIIIYEQADQLAEVGAGIQLSPNVTSILTQWNLLPDLKAAAFKPQGIDIRHWRSGKQVAEFNLNTNRNSAPYLHIHRHVLQQILAKAVLDIAPEAIKFGKKLQQVNSASELIFEDNTRAHCEWLIGADGIHSRVRDWINTGSVKSQFTGQVAWRGLIPKEKLPELKPGPYSTLVMGPKAHLVFYYVNGGSELNYVAIVEHTKWQQESWTSKGSLEQLLDDFSNWHSQYRSVLAATDPDSCYRWALYDRPPLDTWSRDQCLIMGDAAHPMLPSLAQGAGMAIEDAAAIAYCFREFADEHRGKKLHELRFERTSRIQKESHSNINIFHMSNPLLAWSRDKVLSVLASVYPDYMNRRLSWLYDYRPPY